MDEQEPPSELLRFTPFPMPPRAGGWSAERQVAFVQCLARIGVVAVAARSVGMTRGAAYQLRKRAGPDSGFARAWDTALHQAQMRAIDDALEQGYGPIRVPIIRRGVRVGWRERYNNRLLFATLRAMDGLSGRYTAANQPAAGTPAPPSNEVAQPRNGIADPLCKACNSPSRVNRRHAPHRRPPPRPPG